MANCFASVRFPSSSFVDITRISYGSVYATCSQKERCLVKRMIWRSWLGLVVNVAFLRSCLLRIQLNRNSWLAVHPLAYRREPLYFGFWRCRRVGRIRRVVLCCVGRFVLRTGQENPLYCLWRPPHIIISDITS